MRTSALALVAVAALTPALVGGAPFPAPGTYNSDISTQTDAGAPPEDLPASRLHPFIGVKQTRQPQPDHAPSLYQHAKVEPRQADGLAALAGDADKETSGAVDNDASSAVANGGQLVKRVSDLDTLGGNAHTGNSGDVDGGDVVNMADNFGMPTFLNMNSNNAGTGGGSVGGCAVGGHSTKKGYGGNAYAGTPGQAMGGNVWNSGGMMNVDSNNAGAAGLSKTGCAYAGNVTEANPITAPQT
ncbi:hypothetical protein BD311DRAFT_773223 [Dichomitus squalens]|uniref:Uncharacterized protein n=1 Tax=Dichomitus squalens TaxID=114155 RepID=A0A4Q9N3C6_9APHY|nr:hypothetical protein BD311DRAFT_773223 [Dichomitus squalens]